MSSVGSNWDFLTVLSQAHWHSGMFLPVPRLVPSSTSCCDVSRLLCGYDRAVSCNKLWTLPFHSALHHAAYLVELFSVLQCKKFENLLCVYLIQVLNDRKGSGYNNISEFKCLNSSCGAAECEKNT
jgi:hypothetical protein